MKKIFKTSYPSVRKKYGDNVVLNKDNIKDIYLLTDCNTMCINSTIEEYLKKEVQDKIVLEWNDLFINDYLDKIEYLLNKDGLDTIRTICFYFKIVMSIYTNKEQTYLRIILLLKSMYKKYGYFMNYSFMDVDPDSTIIGSFKCIYISMKSQRDFIYERESHGSIHHYMNNIDYVGLLPNMYYLNFMNLYWKCIDELVLPIYNHFKEESKYLVDNNLEYNEKPNNLNDYSMKKLIDNFNNKYNINRKI